MARFASRRAISPLTLRLLNLTAFREVRERTERKIYMARFASRRSIRFLRYPSRQRDVLYRYKQSTGTVQVQ
jgi:hypothetical protein